MEPAFDGIMETPFDGKDIMQWIAAKPLFDQEQATKDHFKRLLKSASQPRHASGNACVRLCYFLEQCRNSTSIIQQKVAFSNKTCQDLFNFYVEWNEKNQHRSMRQVLELLASLITLNPDKTTSSIVKIEVLQRLLSIITHQSAQPFVKPTFKVLECFLSKSTISVAELMEAYSGNHAVGSPAITQSHRPNFYKLGLYDSFVSVIFEWMSFPDTSPAAGKLLVTLFQKLRSEPTENSPLDVVEYSILWQKWIRCGLTRHPDSLENIKNYLFPQLFKLDRIGSLQFLQDLAKRETVGSLDSPEPDAQAFLFLSAMEVGKKSGLVDELNLFEKRSSAKAHSFIILPEDKIGVLSSHSLGSVRSAAFSLLVSSVSSTRPFPKNTLDLLKHRLGLLHTDTDAKFRNEVLSNTKHMVGRLRGAISFLTKGLYSVTDEENQMPLGRTQYLCMSNGSQEEARSLLEHVDFFQWYIRFLLNELVPTASYQRHITALRALRIVVDSGILVPSAKNKLDYLAGSRLTLEFDKDIFAEKMVRSLLDLLMDPFEDVRAAATQLLKMVSIKKYLQQDVKKSSDHQSFPPHPAPTGGLLNHNKVGTSGTSYEVEKESNWRKNSRQFNVPQVLISFIERTEKASESTGRADLADGIARTYELIYSFQTTDDARQNVLESLVLNLESKVVIAENDLAQAVVLAPVHGQFAAIRLAWDLFRQSADVEASQSTDMPSNANDTSLSSKANAAWIDLQYRMIGCCNRIWAAVKDVLCNDSPEGHLPQDLDEIDILDTKDVLSYSFRAIHESSNLLRVIVNKLKLNFADGTPIVPFQVFRAAGSLSFEQLSSLRHRGAFSTVSMTFARCCQLTQEGSIISNPGVSLLEEWYQRTLICIHEQASTTRRSAGIPALVTGILAANSRLPALEDVMTELKILAQQPVVLTTNDETNLSQVHAMNCLKDIFKSSSLGKRCENHIADCLQLAANSLKSKIWAIRNCGLLLLRSLIDCLFGTNESKSATEAGWDGRSIRLAYERYPTLPAILLNLVATEPTQQFAPGSAKNNTVESVFPALDIIRRAGPPKELRVEIYASIKVHLGSSLWHVRDIAARTICTLLLDENWLRGLLELVETCSESINQIHGVLLAVKFLLERRLELGLATAFESLGILTSQLKEFWVFKIQRNISRFTEAAYEEVAIAILRIVHLTVYRPATSSLGYFQEHLRLGRSTEDIFEMANNLLKARLLSRGNDVVEPTITEASSALLVKAVVIHALYRAATEGQVNKVQELVRSAIRYDTDITCNLLDHIPIVWKRKALPAEVILNLADIYIEAYSASSSSHIRNSALRNLADILGRLSSLHGLEQTVLTSNGFRKLGLSLLTRGSPDLSSAEIRITGSLLAIRLTQQTGQGLPEEITEQIQAWGYMLSDNGTSENDFDTRYAAVAALNAFYCACSKQILTHSGDPFLVPSLLALYNTLNDDDDEIRDAGANAVSYILGSRLVPLAASLKFLQWIYQKFGKTEAFCTATMQRIANGNSENSNELKPAEQQLAVAMLDDYSLFVKEEQNLYIDEVREAIIWTSILLTAEGPRWEKAIKKLSQWTLEGIVVLNRLAESNDGPFGWSSKPGVFAICMSIILTAKALLARCNRNLVAERDMLPSSEKAIHESGWNIGINGKLLRDAVHYLLETGRRNSLHSVLLEQLSESLV